MQFSSSTFMALATLIPSTLAHMYVKSPEVYMSANTRALYHNAPLDPSGSNYPCFDTSGLNGAAPTYSAGSSQRFTIAGSAVHGGGSCQISITYDVPVRKDSKFYVLKSFQGDCPLDTPGNIEKEGSWDLDYQIPVNMPNGDAVVAWTWFNRIGNREMYMRCAPVNIKAASEDKSALQKLPPMFKANIQNIGADSCSLKEGAYYRFPNPGSSVHNGNVALENAPAACGAPSSPTPTEPKPEEPKPEEPKPEEPTGRPSLPPVLIGKPDKPDVANPPVAVPTTTSAPIATATVVPVKPGNPKPDTPVKPIPSGGNCAEDGAIICTSVNTWAICDHGSVVPMGRVADGTVCRGGIMEFGNSKRQVRNMRFGHEHRRRHHAKRL